MRINLQPLSLCTQQKEQQTTGDNCPGEAANKYELVQAASANLSSSASQHGFYFILNQMLTNGDCSLHYHFIYTREMQDTLHGQQLELLSLGLLCRRLFFCGLLKLHANGKHPGQMLTGNKLKWHTKVSIFL